MWISSAALLAMLPSVFAIPLVEAPYPGLDVTLSQVEDTRIKAVVKNVGTEDVTFVHINFFKDTAPVQKVALYQHDDSEIVFEGVEKLFQSSGLTEDVLTSLGPGEAYEDEFDVASTSNLSDGGRVTLHSEGRVPTVENGTITGSIPFNSNKLVIDVDGTKASEVAAAMKAKHQKRTAMECCPSSEKHFFLKAALENAARLASQAADAAEWGPEARFQEYFRTADSETRRVVAARFRAAAAEASSTTSGQTHYFCYDIDELCTFNILAWAQKTTNTIANCNLYYAFLHPTAIKCHGQDQASTSLHELMHVPGVFKPGAKDLAYGYKAVTALSPADALNNADTYALFANAVHNDC